MEIRRAPSRRLAAIVAVVGMLAIALAGAGWRWRAGPSVAAYAVERVDLLQTVVASGRVESPRRVEIGSALVGTVAEIPVAEGQAVRAGQLLVALDASEVQAAVAQARFALAQAEARAAQLASTALPVAAESRRQARTNLENAERALGRSRELFARGFIGQAALDETQRLHDVAESQLAAAQLQYASQASGGSDERVALAAIAQARAALRAAEARLALTRIEAPVSGTLISRDVERGNVVQPGKTLMTLSPDGELQIVVQIDEKNLGWLRKGQKAFASADAYPGERFESEVAYINPAVDPLRGSVEVKLSVPRPPSYLLQDMTVSVDIEVGRAVRALAIPAEALRSGDWVLVAREGRARRQDVKVGARGEGRVEITQGLEEGELVLPGTGVATADGAAIRAQRQSAPVSRRS